jgi:predicted transposase/invertase (TIGR01784 family)
LDISLSLDSNLASQITKNSLFTTCRYQYLIGCINRIYSTIERNLSFKLSFIRRDSIFYALFQRSPSLLFELLNVAPDSVNQYRFESVAVKEPKFEIDGVFLPPPSETPGVVYFCEVQFQKDEQLYERLFGESFLYFYRNRNLFADWQAVLIYPSRSIEQTDGHPYRALLNSNQVHRVYLNELGEITQLPLGVALMVLTTVAEETAPDVARMLLNRAAQETTTSVIVQGIIDLIGTIMVYKFTNLSRQEIDAMLGIKLEETRVYREARAEEREKIALNLLQENVSLETISRTTGLSIEQLQQLQTSQVND